MLEVGVFFHLGQHGALGVHWCGPVLVWGKSSPTGVVHKVFTGLYRSWLITWRLEVVDMVDMVPDFYHHGRVWEGPWPAKAVQTMVVVISQVGQVRV